MKVLSIIGARPQFIKAAPLSKALRAAGQHEVILHTGQHYDHMMSSIFIEELSIRSPDYNLEIGSGSHGWQTGKMLIGIEDVLIEVEPDLVILYGDTNSTLAGSLAACKLQIPIAHIEAGLRSFNRRMPEEHNRVLVDHCADLLFCPTQTAVENLAAEGILQGVHLVGDTMKDAIMQNIPIAQNRSDILDSLGIGHKEYYLATIHRPSNADEMNILLNVLTAMNTLGNEVIFPLHPRTKEQLIQSTIEVSHEEAFPNIRFINPVGYLDMLMLEQNARFILTDSGGVQKEAYILEVPCITLRGETEWVETVEKGWNVLVDCGVDDLLTIIRTFRLPEGHPNLFGDGKASERIVKIISTIGP